MITNLIPTARTALCTAALAVLFSAGTAGADSSLIQLEDRINDLVYRISRSVVTVEAAQPRTVGPAGAPGMQAVHTLVSSGLICDTLGRILVAATSVTGRDRIVIRYDNHVLEGRLVGIDYRNGLALVDAGRRVGRPATLSARSRCAGQMIIALGNAFGVRASPSIGFCAGYRPDGFMQFSAPISSGTVGGGVFDFAGNLVGIISGGIGPEQVGEAGLAVPAAQIPEIVAYLLRHGDRHAGYAGIRVADFELSPGLEINYPMTLVSAGRTPGRIIDQGVIVTGVNSGSPAARAGLLGGDLIFAVNGVAIGSAAELQALVRDNPPGTTIQIGYLRRNTPYTVQFETARLQGAIPGPGAPGEAIVPSTVADSLRLEIERLKRAVESLERRLR